jgi:hypothetical protein
MPAKRPGLGRQLRGASLWLGRQAPRHDSGSQGMIAPSLQARVFWVVSNRTRLEACDARIVHHHHVGDGTIAYERLSSLQHTSKQMNRQSAFRAIDAPVMTHVLLFDLGMVPCLTGWLAGGSVRRRRSMSAWLPRGCCRSNTSWTPPMSMRHFWSAVRVTTASHLKDRSGVWPTSINADKASSSATLPLIGTVNRLPARGARPR